MPATTSRRRRTEPTTGTVGVRRLLAEVTGRSAPAGSGAGCYERAVSVVAEEVTELLAILAPPP